MYQVTFISAANQLRTVNTPTAATARVVLFSLRRAGFAARLWLIVQRGKPWPMQ